MVVKKRIKDKIYNFYGSSYKKKTKQIWAQGAKEDGYILFNKI